MISSFYKTSTSSLTKYKEELFFWGLSSRPPAIVEFDMTDLDNIIVNKIFMVYYNYDPYIGQNSMAVNKNYVLHLLVNPDNG